MNWLSITVPVLTAVVLPLLGHAIHIAAWRAKVDKSLEIHTLRLNTMESENREDYLRLAEKIDSGFTELRSSVSSINARISRLEGGLEARGMILLDS